ncbi:MAG: DUF3048 domain-containing protein [Actinomycetota bacterium]|nr:DUF3048 domain-containing protein [Actinomycetota bacterium]
MSRRSKAIAAITAGVIVVGGGAVAFIFFGDELGDKIPIISEITEPDTCPLNGEEPNNADLIGRPAVAVKVENAQLAYPLSGLGNAEIVYEEVVEGGVTRFMAIYHCTDSDKVGPVRSARAVDPAIMIPITRILAYSGQNAPVLRALEEADIVRIDESNAKGSMERVPREGLSSEHTLYADTGKVREVASDKFDESPPEEVFEFGDLEKDGTKSGKQVNISFSDFTNVRYEFSDGTYKRFQPRDNSFDLEEGGQLEVDNVLIEEHEVNNSDIVDVQGNPSTEIADETGKGNAVLFRDGRAIVGSWVRKSTDDLVRFETKSGDQMVFKPGNIWIHLVPSDKGEVKGSFTFE